jgi:hypothetical protein
MELNYKKKKEIFSELRNQPHLVSGGLNEVKISLFKNPQIIEEIKTLRVIELDNLESFLSYVNYDYFLMFKFNEDYYFCDTELVPTYNTQSMTKIVDFNQIFRKDKINKINENSLSN